MKFFTVAFIVQIGFFLLRTTAFAASFVPGEVLIKYRAGSHATGLRGELGKIGWAKIRVGSTASVGQVRKEFKKHPAR